MKVGNKYWCWHRVVLGSNPFPVFVDWGRDSEVRLCEVRINIVFHGDSNGDNGGEDVGEEYNGDNGGEDVGEEYNGDNGGEDVGEEYNGDDENDDNNDDDSENDDIDDDNEENLMNMIRMVMMLKMRMMMMKITKDKGNCGFVIGKTNHISEGDDNHKEKHLLSQENFRLSQFP